MGSVKLHAANKSQVKGEIKAITTKTAKRGRQYDNFNVFYNFDPENDIQNVDFECRGTGFLYS